jgi:catechol 2,3-dioxygenase-like lactoylglutathione lyase family enzyme
VKGLIGVLSLVVFWPAGASWGQVLPPNEAGVSMGHLHTIVRDVETTKKFWVLLGGVPIKVDGVEVVKFPGVLIFLQPGAPSGGDSGNSGSTLDYPGFNMKNGREFLTKLRAEGVKVDPIEGGGLDSGFVSTPDGLRIEMNGKEHDLGKRSMLGFSRKNLDVPIAIDHLHYSLPGKVVVGAQAWYVDLFAAKPMTDEGPCDSPSVDLPGIRLRFCRSGNSTLLPTRGRALDHIGFEVKNLEVFCKALEASGVKFDQPYSKSRHKSFASAELTDPWGTSIELTEGLNHF